MIIIYCCNYSIKEVKLLHVSTSLLMCQWRKKGISSFITIKILSWNIKHSYTNSSHNYNLCFIIFRCAVVTGGNKGIGFEICRQLALTGIEVILTSRNESRGVEAVEKLNSSGLSNVIFHQLDITDSSSIARLAKFIESRFRKLDILVIHVQGHIGLS